MERSSEIIEIAKALSKAQGEMEHASKSEENPHFRSKYADLASVWDALRKPLSSNGLAIVQTLGSETADFLETMLVHSSGQFFISRYPLRPVKSDPQGFASAITYARRYSIMAITGIAPDDDDGNAATFPAGKATATSKWERVGSRLEIDVRPPDDGNAASSPALAGPGEPKRAPVRPTNATGMVSGTAPASAKPEYAFLTPTEQAQFWGTVKALSWEQAAIKKIMLDDYQVESTSKLTRAQADEIIAGIRNWWPKEPGSEG